MAPWPLLDDVLRSLTPDLVSRASALFGEPEGALAKGLAAAAPSLLMGLVQKSNDASFVQRLLGLANEPSVSSFDPASALSAISSGSGPLVDIGSRLLSSVFGANTSAVGDLLARYAGLRPASGASLLGLVAPLVLSAIRGRAQREGLDATGLGRWLSSQRDSIASAAPPGLASALAGEPRRREPVSVADAMRRVVALQAQEPASPYLALWNRVAGFDAGEVGGKVLHHHHIDTIGT